MTPRSAPAVRRMTLAAGVALALALGGALPASAEDIPEGDTPVVLSIDQSSFGMIPEVFEAGGSSSDLPDIELELFGGPEIPEITMWTTTALSFDAEARVYVALLSAAQLSQESEEFLCALRVYDEGGAPLGPPQSIVNPDDDGPGVWPSACTGLALLDILGGYGLDFDLATGFVETETETVSTDALVFFADGSSARVDGRSGEVLDTLSGSTGGFGDLGSVAITAGPAELLDPDRTGVAVLLVAFYENAYIVGVQYEGDALQSELRASGATVLGAEFDSELNLWILTFGETGDDVIALSIGYAELTEPAVGPTSTQLLPGDLGAASLLENLGPVDEGPSALSFAPAAISGGVLVGDSGTFTPSGIAIARGPVELASDDDGAGELAATGPDDQLILTLGIVAGAILVAGIVVTAVAAARRRSQRE